MIESIVCAMGTGVLIGLIIALVKEKPWNYW